jgi:hypothetical protein
MRAVFLSLACFALVGLAGCEFETPTQQVQTSKVLEVMVQAGAGNPERWTEEGLAMWFAQHDPVFRQVEMLCAPGGQADMNRVSKSEWIACDAAAQRQALLNVYGYAEPQASGKAW